MKYLKILGLAALVAMALTGVTASSASATTLEIGGVTQNKAVTATLSLEPGTSVTFSTTGSATLFTCTGSQVEAVTTGPFSGDIVPAAVNLLTFTDCTGPATVHYSGQLYVKHIPGSTNGTVFWSNTEVTYNWARIYEVAKCKTGSDAHVGTLTGVSSGHATLDINAVLNCGFLLPSMRWQASYVVTSPTMLGVSA